MQLFSPYEQATCLDSEKNAFAKQMPRGESSPFSARRQNTKLWNPSGIEVGNDTLGNGRG